MTSERWQRLKAVVNDALERAGDERAAFLDEACAGDAALRAEAERLLDLERGAGGFLERPPELVREDDLVGRRVGRYVVMKRLAAGGMGTVYEAEQDNPRRTVALKVVRPGLATGSTLRRFEHEAQVLGRLQHPGIARIHEAGAFDFGDGARPFFAMELVDGLPLTEDAERHGLDVRARVELLIAVGHAVQHAHQKGIVHRDLKPANILVERAEGAAPQPKVLDFGVARAIDADSPRTRTLTGELVGTLAYMSPEQLAGDPRDVDTRADVFALGVVAFELLTGRLPFDAPSGSIAEVSRAIVEHAPRRLADVDRRLRGDLDTIVGVALEKDPRRRYATVGAMTADLERFLRHEPIHARPPTATYRLRTFVRRHRVLVGGIAATFGALATGMVLYAVEARHARNEAANATYEAEKYRAVHDFIVNDVLWTMLDAMGEGAPDHDARVAALVDDAAARIDAVFPSEPLHAAAVRNQIATMHYNLGRYAEAEALFTACLETRRRLLGPDHRDTLNATNNVGLCQMRQGRTDEAVVHYRAALAGRRRTLGDEHPDTLVSMNNLAALLRRTGDLAEAEALLRRAVEVQTRVRGPAHGDTLTSTSNLAGVVAARGDLDAAEALHRAAVEGLERALGPDHVTTLVATTRLGALLLERERAGEAEALLRRAANGLDRILGDEHGHTLAAFDGLVQALMAQGRFDDAEPYARRALAGHRSSLGADHPSAQAAQARLEDVREAMGGG